jgi:hypothetical protein
MNAVHVYAVQGCVEGIVYLHERPDPHAWLKILPSLHRTIDALFANGSVEPRRWVFRVELLSDSGLDRCLLIALFFIVSLAQVGAGQSVIGIEAHGDFHVFMTCFQATITSCTVR